MNLIPFLTPFLLVDVNFNKLLPIVKCWNDTKIILLGESDLKFKKIIYFDDTKKVVDHIRMGINPHINSSEFIRPKLNYYIPFVAFMFYGCYFLCHIKCSEFFRLTDF